MVTKNYVPRVANTFGVLDEPYLRSVQGLKEPKMIPKALYRIGTLWTLSQLSAPYNQRLRSPGQAQSLGG